MELVKCPACEREISELAAVCVGCGHPQFAPPKRSLLRSLSASVLNLALGCVCAMFAALSVASLCVSFVLLLDSATVMHEQLAAQVAVFSAVSALVSVACLIAVGRD